MIKPFIALFVILQSPLTPLEMEESPYIVPWHKQRVEFVTEVLKPRFTDHMECQKKAEQLNAMRGQPMASGMKTVIAGAFCGVPVVDAASQVKGK